MHLLSNLPSSYKIRETRRPHGTTFHRQRRKTAPSRENRKGSQRHGLPARIRPSMEEIADEMVAICDDRSFWREKKEAEFYQNKYNEMLWQSKFEDDEDE